MTSLLISHPSFLAHDTGQYHPERPDRLRAVLAGLDDAAIAHLVSIVAPAATLDTPRRHQDQGRRRRRWRRRQPGLPACVAQARARTCRSF